MEGAAVSVWSLLELSQTLPQLFCSVARKTQRRVAHTHRQKRGRAAHVSEHTPFCLSHTCPTSPPAPPQHQPLSFFFFFPLFALSLSPLPAFIQCVMDKTKVIFSLLSGCCFSSPPSSPPSLPPRLPLCLPLFLFSCS